VGIEDFHFLRAYWLLALPFLGFLVWYWFRRTQEGNGWEGKIDSSLLHALIDSSQKRSGRMLLITMWLAAFLSIIGAAGPAWQKLPQDVEQKQDTLVILLDLSLSMLATDVQPSRLERARQKVADVLRTRIEGETALVAYAGDAHTVVPLTDDVATIENLLFSLSPEMIRKLGLLTRPNSNYHRRH
jgi:Ca-activated chloride channel family protein